jgi:quinol monooxygenase YgiN
MFSRSTKTRLSSSSRRRLRPHAKTTANLRYDVVQWDGHPNHFTLIEVWRDRKAFDASVTAPHNKEFRDKLTPLEGALYDERLYQGVK